MIYGNRAIARMLARITALEKQIMALQDAIKNIDNVIGRSI